MRNCKRLGAQDVPLTATLVAVALFGFGLFSDRAAADGALAVGLPEDVAKTGFAFGWSTNRASGQEARQAALEFCRKAKDASAGAQKLCRVFGSFKGQCVAVAMDPKDGTPGVGWAMSTEKAWAEAEALDACRETAGPRRQGECKLSASACDGK